MACFNSFDNPPVMGTYRCLLLGVVPVCAVKRRVVGEGKKTSLWGFQSEMRNEETHVSFNLFFPIIIQNETVFFRLHSMASPWDNIEYVKCVNTL